METINEERIGDCLDQSPLVVVSTLTSPKQHLVVDSPGRRLDHTDYVIRGLIETGWHLIGTDNNRAYFNRDKPWRTQ